MSTSSDTGSDRAWAAEIGDAVAEVEPGWPQLRDVRGGVQRFGGQVQVRLVPLPDAVVGLLHLAGARARGPSLTGQPLVDGGGLVPGGLKVVKGILRNPGHRREPSVMDVQASEPRLDVGALQQADGEFLTGPGGEVHFLQQLAAVPQGRAVVQPPLHLIGGRVQDGPTVPSESVAHLGGQHGDAVRQLFRSR
jgi:hypothetical protein